MARRSKHSAQKRRRELARAEKQERKRERRANPVEHDPDTLIAEYRGVYVPGDTESETTDDVASEEEESQSPEVST